MKTTATEQETDSILLENSFEGHRDGESKPWAQGRTQFLYHHHYLTSQPPSSHEALPFVPAGHCLGTVVTLWRELQFDSTTAATFEMAIANYSPVKFYLISHATRQTSTYSKQQTQWRWREREKKATVREPLVSWSVHLNSCTSKISS